tara:strand:+ start:703 stop:921 length:219 start_codon:yes stop_codon:yes gene_type:complete
MRFYQVQDIAQQEGVHESAEWFTTRREAEKRAREIDREDGTAFVRTFDIPTTKKALLAWLNHYGNPTGMGFN